MRPKRIYKLGDKYYYIINGKRKYIKMPKKLSDRQVVNINIKTGDSYGKKIKKRKSRRKTMKYTKKIIPNMTERATSATIIPSFLPTTLYQPQKQIPSLSLIAENQTKLIKDEEDKKKENMLMIKNEVDKEMNKIKRVVNVLEEDVVETKKKPLKKKKEDISEDESNKRNIIQTELGDYINKWLGNKKTISDRSVAFARFKEQIKNDAETNRGLKQLETYLLDEKNKTWVNNYYKDYIIDYRVNLSKGVKPDISSRVEEVEETEGAEESKGSGYSDVDGLWNTDIEKIVDKKIKNIVPVITADGEKELMPYIKRNMPSFSFIINRLSSDYDGTGKNGEPSGHWIAVHINNNDDFQSCEIYDSLAEPPSTDLIKLCKKLSKMINPEQTFKLKINHLKNQANTTDTCGYHAIKFLEDRNNGVPWSEATNYDSYIENLQNANNEKDGENKIDKVIDDYNLYL